VNACAFEDCPAIKEIVVPEGCEVIGSWAFASCERLENVVLPETIREIKSLAFHSVCEDGRALKTLTLPASLESISWLTFSVFHAENKESDGKLEENNRMTVFFLGEAPTVIYKQNDDVDQIHITAVCPDEYLAAYQTENFALLGAEVIPLSEYLLGQ
ncbi:MAG: leucine-rich repeat domain-containing protein, partial [Eubacteriales bacterium]